MFFLGVKMTKVAVVLDTTSMVIYRCQPKPRRFVGFWSFPQHEIRLESTAFCGICSDNNYAIAGYKFRHPNGNRLDRLVSDGINHDLTAAFRAMLVLDCLELVTPYTPAEMLRLLKTNDGRIDLADWIGDEASASINRADPPEVGRVFAFLHCHGIHNIFDSRAAEPSFSDKALNAIAAFAVNALDSDAVSRFASTLPALRKD